MEICEPEMRRLPDFYLPNNQIHPLFRHPPGIWRNKKPNFVSRPRIVIMPKNVPKYLPKFN